MTMVTDNATEMMSTTAGFHRHHARRQVRGELDDTVPLHPSPHDDLSSAVQTHHTAAVLPQVDPENRDLHWHAPFPSGCPTQLTPVGRGAGHSIKVSPAAWTRSRARRASSPPP